MQGGDAALKRELGALIPGEESHRPSDVAIVLWIRVQLDQLYQFSLENREHPQPRIRIKRKEPIRELVCLLLGRASNEAERRRDALVARADVEGVGAAPYPEVGKNRPDPLARSEEWRLIQHRLCNSPMVQAST